MKGKMLMKRLTVLAVIMVLLVAGGACADKDGAPVFRGSADVVKVSPAPGAVSAAPGQRIDFNINLDIAKKWHIYAHGDSNFIGVDLTPDSGPALDNFKLEFPHGHQGEFFGEKVMMIEGKEAIKASGVIPADLAKGEHIMKFSVTAQACDDKACLAPAEIPVSVKLTVK